MPGFTISLPPKAERYINAGFEYRAFILGAADVLFLFSNYFALLLVFVLLRLAFGMFGARKARGFADKKVKGFKFNNFIQLYEASFLILTLCSYVNCEISNLTSGLEGIQSIVSITIFGICASTPYVTFRFFKKNFKKIQDPDNNPEFH